MTKPPQTPKVSTTAPLPPPETAVPGGASPETAVSTPPAPPRTEIRSLDELVEVLQEGQFSPLFVATCAAVAGTMVPRGCRLDAASTDSERLYIQWAVRTAVEAAFLAEEAALEFKEAKQTGDLPPWATLIHHQGASISAGPVG